MYVKSGGSNDVLPLDHVVRDILAFLKLSLMCLIGLHSLLMNLVFSLDILGALYLPSAQILNDLFKFSPNCS